MTRRQGSNGSGRTRRGDVLVAFRMQGARPPEKRRGRRFYEAASPESGHEPNGTSLNGPSKRRFVLNSGAALEEGVDKRGGALASDDDEAEDEQYQDHGNNPPGLVFPGEGEEFTEQVSDMFENAHAVLIQYVGPYIAPTSLVACLKVSRSKVKSLCAANEWLTFDF